MKSLSGLGIELCFEHHPREKWSWYADRVQELGVSFVRMGEFIWDNLERGEGRFNFSDLDAWIALLAERDIGTWLATPTASPPDWLCAQSSEVLPVSMDGRRMAGESRRHTCPTSPEFRRHAERIVIALGCRYAGNSSVIAWQIDNEIGHPFCYCPLCHKAFQRWLETEFGDIEAFNFALGQSFWARTSRSFSEVPLPGPASNPCLHQVYQRFMDHQIRECWGLQEKWLRDAGVVAPITTNAMLTWHGYDHEKFFGSLDVVTGDSYPRTHGGLYAEGQFPGLSFLAAFLRGMKHGQNFGMAEMRCGPAEGLPQYPLPGEMQFWTHIFFGTGADFVSFFRLDTCPSGRERNTCGMLPASGAIPGIFGEFKNLASETRKLLPLLRETTVPAAKIGLLYSHSAHVALNIRPEFSEFKGPYGNGYTMHLARHFRALADGGFSADVVQIGEDFLKYRVLVVSGLTVIEENLARRLEDFVRSGGTLILWPWSGVMDENGKMHERSWPAFLEHVAGLEYVETEEFSPAQNPVGLIAPDAAMTSFRSSGLVQILRPAIGSNIMAILQGHPVGENLPGWVRNALGQGTCHTVACVFEERDLGSFYRLLLKDCKIEPDFSYPPGVHGTRRIGEDFELQFVFNSSDQPRTLRFSSSVWNVLTDRPEQEIVLAPLGVAILKIPVSPRI